MHMQGFIAPSFGPLRPGQRHYSTHAHCFWTKIQDEIKAV